MVTVAQVQAVVSDRPYSCVALKFCALQWGNGRANSRRGIWLAVRELRWSVSKRISEDKRASFFQSHIVVNQQPVEKLAIHFKST